MATGWFGASVIIGIVVLILANRHVVRVLLFSVHFWSCDFMIVPPLR
jgi:hypothetical protein